MALPTLPAYWQMKYKNIQEKNIVQRRNHDHDFREKWAQNANYFHQSDVQTTKQRAWSSDSSFQDSMDAFKRKHESETKKIRLTERRRKLQQLIQSERDQYEAELKGLSSDNYRRLDSMRERSEELKTQKETARKQIADEKLYQHFRKNNPDLRKIESEQHKQFVINKWSEQVEEMEDRLESAREDKRKFDEELERERLAAVERDRKYQEAKYRDEKEQAAMLKEQMMELRAREAEASRLKQAEADLMKQQWQLEQLESQRKALEERRKKSELGRVLTRQYKAQLRRRSQQVQEALELDRRILAALAEKQDEDMQVQTARREKARADAAWMKQVVEDQLKLEQAREAELDMLYRDEAARVWQKRESEWEREKKARERLMSEVLQGRQEQIHDKMEEVRIQQEESLERREELIRDLELAQQLTHREQAVAEQKKKETRAEIDAQLTERRDREAEARRRLEDELERERMAERDYEEMLREEASQMSIRGFEPQSHPRPRSAWD
ncbi:trichoplein keratin filament-binding protein-like [Saccoglossus kowalevskii]|uniref:Trichoplein keratin filament-binding protein n=1 Tax=Saccoglossus kowalevskii TaxID=10224 RepID=A0ABM0GNX1_SACKO|nr:PREDICTED: trichoplein keratin filament-binding protein-like isoform X1 [Saccoglossus kowalevskii]XP_006815737.1 PREDICTED: trichoplein keratin filament-binding protein-like isoform X2 [Saccoglossus kowalevskii]